MPGNALACPDIEMIQSDSLHAHFCLHGAGGRSGEIHPFENLRTAVFLDLPGFHESARSSDGFRDLRTGNSEFFVKLDRFAALTEEILDPKFEKLRA